MSCTINASVTNNGLIHGADASGNLQIQSNGTAALNFVTNGKVVFPSTSLGTASAGTIEYDGSVPYFTPLGTQRGIVPGTQFYSLNSSLLGANATGAQNILGVGVTLSSSTQYYFELMFGLSKSAGTTSHVPSILFGGTSSLNASNYYCIRGGSTSSFTDLFGSLASLIASVTSTTAIAQAQTSATVYFMVSLRGVVSVSTGGTLIPQYSLSAAPGGAYTTAAGSYMLIYPIGASGSNISVGTWA